MGETRRVRRTVIADLMRLPSIARMADELRNATRPRTQKTTEFYALGVRHFAQFLKTQSPEALLEEYRAGNRDIFADLLAFIRDYSRRMAGKTLTGYVYGVKNWGLANGLDMGQWGVRLRLQMPINESVEVDRAPTKDELREIMDASDPRNRVITAVATSSGLRIGTLTSLTWGDIDFQTYQDVAAIRVDRAAGRKMKLGHKFFVTFLTPEARRMLEGYRKTLQSRMEVTPKTPLFLTEDGSAALSSVSLRSEWNDVLAKVGMATKHSRADENQTAGTVHELHFHVLRKFFRTQVGAAGVPSSFFEFWLGHKGGGGYLDASYFRASDNEHVQQYRRAVPNLTVYGEPKRDMKEMEERVRKLEAAGLDRETIEYIKASRATVAKETEERRQKRPSHRIASEDDACRLMDEGWEFKGSLSDGRVILELPGAPP
jgi:integrase